MFSHLPDPDRRAQQVIDELADHALNRSHARHISLERARSIGLEIEELELDQGLQDVVLAVHHSLIHTLSGTDAIKVIENQEGRAFIQQFRFQAV